MTIIFSGKTFFEREGCMVSLIQKIRLGLHFPKLAMVGLCEDTLSAA